MTLAKVKGLLCVKTFEAIRYSRTRQKKKINERIGGVVQRVEDHWGGVENQTQGKIVRGAEAITVFATHQKGRTPLVELGTK